MCVQILRSIGITWTNLENMQKSNVYLTSRDANKGTSFVNIILLMTL